MAGYKVSYSFSGWQNYNPSSPLPAQKLDIELYNIQQAISELWSSLGVTKATNGEYPIMRDEALKALVATTTGGVNAYDAFGAWLPASEKEVANIQFMAPFWPVGSDVWNDVQTALNAVVPGGFSDDDLTALQALALSYRSL